MGSTPVAVVLVLFYRRRAANPLTGLNQVCRDLPGRKAGATVSQQEDDSEIGELPRSTERHRAMVGEATRSHGGQMKARGAKSGQQIAFQDSTV